MAICTSIELVERGAQEQSDLLRVTIDNTTTAYWFYEYANAMQYLNQDVIVEYRKDILKGELTQFIKTFTIPTVVHTLDKKENIKLYIDQVDNNSNISFNDIADGETAQGAIVYCTSSKFNSSNRAVWQELIIRDKSMHTATLRIFDYENKEAKLEGQYVMAALKRSKYGFQSEYVTPVNGEVASNPEIDLAIQFIKNYFADDSLALQYLANTHLIEHLQETIDYEKGYGLMRLAMELAMVDSMKNITNDVDLAAIGRALMCSYGHYTRQSILSESVNNVTLVLSYKFDNLPTIAKLLDEALEEKPVEFTVYRHVKDTVAAILEVRKGTT